MRSARLLTSPPAPQSAFPGAVWPALPAGAGISLLALLQQLETTQYLPPEELRARQFRQIGELVKQVDRCVPFYGPSLRRAGLRADREITEAAWAAMPVLTRRAVQEAGEALQASDWPERHGRSVAMSTSGSTGMRVEVCKTELEQLYFHAFSLRETLWHRRDVSRAFLAIRHDDSRIVLDESVHIRRLPNWGTPVALVYPTGPAVLLDVRCPVAAQLEVLQRENPGYLLSFGSNLVALARLARAQGVALPGLRGLIGSGEVLPAEARALCREVWGVEVADMYSAVEVGCIAFQCPGHDHYHVQSESALVEVLDESGNPCAPGETGRVVVTPLHNLAMPLLRYELGDYAELGGPCPCGRTLPVLTRIHGRARDMLTLPGGGRRFAHYGKNGLLAVSAVLQHQVVQTARDEIVIRLVVRRSLTADEEAQILAAVATGLGHPFRLRLDYVDALARSPGGKFQEFRSELPPGPPA